VYDKMSFDHRTVGFGLMRGLYISQPAITTRDLVIPFEVEIQEGNELEVILDE